MEENKGYVSRKQVLKKLFFSMLYISAFTFGGGFVIITFMKRKFVDELCWINEQEMLDMTALAQSAPGAIAVNAAILIGRRMAGFAGMAAAVLGTIIPPMVILSIVSVFYAVFSANPYVAMTLKGMQAGVAAVIADVVYDMGRKVVSNRSLLQDATMVLAFTATFFFNINVVYIILVTALSGVVNVLMEKRKKVRL